MTLASLSRRSRREWGLFLRALGLVWMVRLALWALPFQRVRRLTSRLSRAGASRPVDETVSVKTLTWAVRAASRWVPAASCLTQALVAQIMLANRGLPHALHIGVARGERGTFEAHAWIESEGRVVLGGLPDLARFTRLPPLPDEAGV